MKQTFIFWWITVGDITEDYLAFNLQDSYYLNMEEYYVNIHIKNIWGFEKKWIVHISNELKKQTKQKEKRNKKQKTQLFAIAWSSCPEWYFFIHIQVLIFWRFKLHNGIRHVQHKQERTMTENFKNL